MVMSLSAYESPDATQAIADITADAILPSGWTCVYVEDIARVTTGSRNTQDRTDDGAYPFFVRSQNIERISSNSFDTEAVLTAGDGVGTGKVFHHIVGKFDAHQRVYVIHDFSARVRGYYFYLAFKRGFYDRIIQMTAKSSVDSVRREMITRMPIALPPIEEQDRIIEAMKDAAASVESLECMIAKKKQIILAVGRELLSRERRLPGYSSSWCEAKLGAIGVFVKGSGVKKSDANSGSLPCVRYGELYTNHHNVIRTFRSYVSNEVAASALRLRQGDVLFAGSGETKEEIGKSAAFLDDVEAYAGGDIIVLRTRDADPVFLGYYLNSGPVQAQKASRGQGDAVVHISAKALADIDVWLPERSEQAAIGAILLDLDKQLQALNDRSSKARLIKEGMMQDLLSGRVRLL